MELRLREESHINKEILISVAFQMDLAAWATAPLYHTVRAILSKGFKADFCHRSHLGLLWHLCAEAAAPGPWRGRTPWGSERRQGGLRVPAPRQVPAAAGAGAAPLPQRARTPALPHLPYLRVPAAVAEGIRAPAAWRAAEGGREGGRERGTALPRSGPGRRHLLLLPPSAAPRGGSSWGNPGRPRLSGRPPRPGRVRRCERLSWGVPHPLDPSGAASNPVREVQEKGKLRNSEQAPNAPSKSMFLAPAGCKLCESCALTTAFLLPNNGETECSQGSGLGRAVAVGAAFPHPQWAVHHEAAPLQCPSQICSCPSAPGVTASSFIINHANSHIQTPQTHSQNNWSGFLCPTGACAELQIQGLYWNGT